VPSWALSPCVLVAVWAPQACLRSTDLKRLN
jgi:hypothetical protein